ncbi:MAG: hypothetical protein JKY54_00285 [Flavobacteriales bacterium]|nr:hypothetical protein [Flavobacteriales bacterium]
MKWSLLIIPLLFLSCLENSRSEEQPENWQENESSRAFRDVMNEFMEGYNEASESNDPFSDFSDEQFDSVKIAVIDIQENFITWIQGYQNLYGDDHSKVYEENFKRCKGYMAQSISWNELLRRLNDMDAMHLEFTELPKHKAILYEKYDQEWKKTLILQTRLYKIRNLYNLW